MNLPKKRRIVAALLVLLIVTSGAAAYTVVYTSGAGGSWEAGSGLEVSSAVDHGISDRNPFNDSSTIYLSGVEISSDYDTSVTVDTWTGTRTSLSSIDATAGAVTIDPNDKNAVSISGGVTAFSWEDSALDGSAQISYSASSSGLITVSGLASETTFAAATTSGTILSSGTTTSTGEATISVDSASSDDIVLLEPSPATASNLDPDGTETNNENVELSFDLADADFATDAGDSVDVDLVVDGSTVNSWTGVTSNQTLSYTVQDLGDGQHDWHVETTDEYGLTSTSSTASFTVNHYAPELSNFEPADGSQLTSREQNFSVDVADIDFAEPSGDMVTAELFIDGNSVGLDTVSSNTTAQISTTVSDGGSHDYYWVATDEYGQSTTSATRSISVPSTLSIYNESSPTELVTNATVELRMYANELDTPEVYTRSTSDGQINMTGLPVNQPFIVVASADNYTERRIFVPNLYETQSIYLLPDNEPAVDTVFSIQDYTGQYPQDNTVLEVQRSLNGSYQTVLGDYFGANGEFPAQVAYNTRHRLVLRNIKTGNTRVLGTYTPIASGVETVAVSPDGTISIEDRPISVDFPGVTRLPAGDSVDFNVSVVEGSNPVESWTLNVTSNSNSIYTKSTTEKFLDTQLDLSNYEGSNVTATVTATLENGDTRVVEEEYTVTRILQNDDSLLASLGRFVDLAPAENQDSMTTFLAMMLTVFITGTIRWAIPMPTEVTGLSAWLVLAGFGVLGWVPYTMVFVAGAGAISFAYLGGVR